MKKFSIFVSFEIEHEHRTYLSNTSFRRRSADGRQRSIVVCVPHKVHKVQLISLSFYGQRRRCSHSALIENPNMTLATHWHRLFAFQPTHARCTFVSVLFSCFVFLLFVRFCSVCSFGGDFVVVVTQMESMAVRSIITSLHQSSSIHTLNTF